MRWMKRAAPAVLCALALTCTAMGAGAFHRTAAPQAQMLEQTDGLYCALRAPALPEGSSVSVCDAEGKLLHTAALDGQAEALLGPLEPGREYVLRFPDGREGRFRLARNAAVSAADAVLQADGELLYYSTALDRLAALPSWKQGK